MLKVLYEKIVKLKSMPSFLKHKMRVGSMQDLFVLFVGFVAVIMVNIVGFGMYRESEAYGTRDVTNPQGTDLSDGSYINNSYLAYYLTNYGTISGNFFQGCVVYNYDDGIISGGTFSKNNACNSKYYDGAVLNGRTEELNYTSKIIGGTFYVNITNYAIIEEGTFFADKGPSGNYPSNSYINNYNEINGGTFYGDVSNYNSGVINDGLFYNLPDTTSTVKTESVNSAINGGVFYTQITNKGLINGGTFNGTITNNSSGRITEGVFNQTVSNSGIISGGTFNSTLTGSSVINGGHFINNVTDNGLINGGIFDGPVTESGNINGGTFNAIVTANGILNGTFNSIVSCDSITSGTFNSDVNCKSITNGTFNSSVSCDSIVGGTFNDAVTCTSVTGGSFKQNPVELLSTGSGYIVNHSDDMYIVEPGSILSHFSPTVLNVDTGTSAIIEAIGTEGNSITSIKNINDLPVGMSITNTETNPITINVSPNCAAGDYVIPVIITAGNKQSKVNMSVKVVQYTPMITQLSNIPTGAVYKAGTYNNTSQANSSIGSYFDSGNITTYPGGSYATIDSAKISDIINNMEISRATSLDLSTLPITTTDQDNSNKGSVFMQSFKIKGTMFGDVERPEKLFVYNVIDKEHVEILNYVSQTELNANGASDGTFTIQNSDETYPEALNSTDEYLLTVFIKDGGKYDTDHTENGYITTCLSIDPTKTKEKVSEPFAPVIPSDVTLPDTIKSSDSFGYPDIRDARNVLSSDFEATGIGKDSNGQYSIINNAAEILTDKKYSTATDEQISTLPITTTSTDSDNIGKIILSSVYVSCDVFGEITDPSKLFIYNTISSENAEPLLYTDDTTSAADGSFTVQNKNGTIASTIESGKNYIITTFLKDGGEHDLDHTENGTVTQALFIDTSRTKDITAEPTDPLVAQTDTLPSDVSPQTAKGFSDTSKASDASDGNIATSDIIIDPCTGMGVIKSSAACDIIGNKTSTVINPESLQTFPIAATTESADLTGKIIMTSFSQELKFDTTTNPSEVSLYQTGSESALGLDYISKISDAKDGTFTIQNTDGTIAKNINSGQQYLITTFIKDGGAYDLDGQENGSVLTSIIIDSEQEAQKAPKPVKPVIDITATEAKVEIATGTQSIEAVREVTATDIDDVDLIQDVNHKYISINPETVVNILSSSDITVNNLHPLPISYTDPKAENAGKVIAVSLCVYHTDLSVVQPTQILASDNSSKIVTNPADIRLLNILNSTSMSVEELKYVTNLSEATDGTFMIHNEDGTVAEKIQYGKIYIVTAFIQDGGKYDAGTANDGSVTSALCILTQVQEEDAAQEDDDTDGDNTGGSTIVQPINQIQYITKSDGGGCNAGISSLILLIPAAAIAVIKRKK